VNALGWLAFLVAAGVGATGRYLLSLFVQRRAASNRPWGTFSVNALGCLLAGLVAGAVLHHDLGDLPARILAVGFLGSFTTFSTLTYETVRLAEEGEVSTAFISVGASVVVGVLAVAAGLGVVAGLT
jgi:fluoride exporter